MKAFFTKQTEVGTGEVKPLSADERLLKQAVARCLKAQVAEVHGRLVGGMEVKGGPGSGNFGHEGRPGEVGGSGPGGGGSRSVSPGSVRSLQDLRTIAQMGSLPKDDDKYEYFYHAFRYRGDADTLLQGGKEGKTWLSKDEIRDRGAGYAVVRVPKGEAVEGRDFVEPGLTYREWIVDKIPASNIVSIVRDVPVGSGGHGIRENKLAAWAIDHQGEDTSDLPEAYRGWFNIKEAKSLKSHSLTSAVPSSTKPWDDMVMREVRPIWFGLFKKGGDKALQNIRKFPKHAKKMAVLSWAEMQASERVEVVEKGGPGSGNFGHSGRPGEVGGSGPGSMGAPEKGSVILYHGTKLGVKDAILKEGIKARVRLPDGRGSGVWMSDDLTNCTLYAREDGIIFEVRLSSLDVEKIAGNYYSSKDSDTIPPNKITAYYLYGGKGHVQRMDSWERHEVETQKGVSRLAFFIPVQIVDIGSKSLKATPSIVIPEWIEDPDVLDALEKEMFKFAQGIDQTTADMLREELIEGMGNGETISQLAARISDLSDEWVEGWRSEMIARTETARAFTEGHIEAWKSTGVVSRKVWVAAADACPFCLEMDGTVVDLEDTFFDQGDEQDVEWRGQDLTMDHDYSDVNGPPLHPNCRCAVIAELDEGKMLSLKGEDVGHPFRGNQFTSGESGSSDVGKGKYAGVKTAMNEKDIATGKMGRGWFVMPDPKGTLVDVTNDFGGGTNDHVGIFVMAEHPETFGLSKKLAAQVDAEMESGDYDKTGEAWEKVFEQGIVRVRDFPPSVSGSPRTIAIDGRQSAVGLSRIQDYIARGKIPSDSRADYAVDIGHYATVSLSVLVSAGSYEELQRHSKSIKARPVKGRGDEFGHGLDRSNGVLGVAKGDLPGHEFHGNQYTGGGTFFHGTTESRAKRILSEGLIPGGHGKGWYTGKENHVFVAKRFDVCSSYATERLAQTGRPGTAIILKVVIPKGEPLFRDTRVSVFHKGIIPAEWIKGYTPISVSANGKIRRGDFVSSKKAVDEMDERYVPVWFFEDENDAEAKGGPGSGNFGHEGRPGEVGGSGPGGGMGGSIPVVIKGTASQDAMERARTSLIGIPPQYLRKIKSIEVLKEPGPPIDINGVQVYTRGGEWHERDGVIKIFAADSGTQAGMDYIISHEIGHALHDDWWDRANAEQNAVMEKHPEWFDFAGVPYNRFEANIKQATPLYNAREEFMINWKAGGDGVTSYSEAWVKDGQWSETTAELFRIYSSEGAEGVTKVCHDLIRNRPEREAVGKAFLTAVKVMREENV